MPANDPDGNNIGAAADRHTLAHTAVHTLPIDVLLARVIGSRGSRLQRAHLCRPTTGSLRACETGQEGDFELIGTEYGTRRERVAGIEPA